MIPDRREIDSTIARLSREGRHDELGKYVASLFSPKMAIVCYGDEEFIGRYRTEFERLHEDDVFVPLEVKKFRNNELWVKVDGNVRRKRVYVVHNFVPYDSDDSEFDPNEPLLTLLIINDALRRASADEITNIVPFIPYLRQDRKDEGRVPISAKLVFDLLVASGAKRIVTFDMHADQEQGFTNYPVDHLTALSLIAEEVFGKNRYDIDPNDISVAATDAGSANTVERFKKICDYRYRTDLRMAVLGKKSEYEQESSIRSKESGVSFVLGDVKSNVLMLDDLIDTAVSMCDGSEALRAKGAKRIIAAATHGVFSPKEVKGLPEAAEDKLKQYSIKTIVTDYIPRTSRYLKKHPEISMIPLAPTLAEVTHRIDSGDPVSELFKWGE